MVVKRKDKRGRNLRNGECQRKDGRYQYEYTDADGEVRCVYSWKLEPTDPLNVSVYHLGRRNERSNKR